MRVLVFEAVTGGGMWLFGDSKPPASLVAEGLAMVGCLTADSLRPVSGPRIDRLQIAGEDDLNKSLSSVVRNVDAADGGFVNFARQIIGCRLGSLRDESSIEVAVLWDQRLEAFPRMGSVPVAPKILTAAIRAGQDDLSQVYDRDFPEATKFQRCQAFEFSRLESNELEPRPVLFQADVESFGQGWKIQQWGDRLSNCLDHAGSSLELSTQHLNPRLSVIPVEGLQSTVAALRVEAEKADVILLIAPEPTQQYWQTLLSFAADKLVCSSLELIALCEDKSCSTTIASLVVDSCHQEKPRSLNRSRSQENFDQVFCDADALCVKPVNSCGATDVWRLQLRRPFASIDHLTEFVFAMRRELEIQTSEDQRLLISPWIEGRAFSVSMIVGRERVQVLPACEQLLERECLTLPEKFLDQLESCHKVSYAGGRLVTADVAGRWQQKAMHQLQNLFTSDQLDAFCGWVGIDAIADSDDRVSIVEVNARLTSSYNLLRRLRSI